MPTPPDFTNGTPLDASSLNKVGLWHVVTVSPTPATTIAINNCFSSSFTNYSIICTPIGLSAPSDITLRLRSGASPSIVGYYISNIFVEGTSIQSVGENNTTSWRAMNIGSVGTGPINSLKFELYGPGASINTRYQMNSGGWNGSTIRNRSGIGFHDVATPYDGFDLTASGNISATISVYGYNKG